MQTIYFDQVGHKCQSKSKQKKGSARTAPQCPSFGEINGSGCLQIFHQISDNYNIMIVLVWDISRYL